MAEDKKDWELHPENYLTDEEGSFVLKLDGTPKKKAGRKVGVKSKAYNYSSEQKAKIAARKSVKQTENRIKSLNKQIASKKATLSKKKEVFKKLDSLSNNQVIEEEILKELPPSVQKHIEENKDNVVFKANEGPQESFLAAGELDVLYGGAAGGGKSYAMLVDPLRYAHRAAHRALILRRSMPELRELIDKSRELYPKAFPGCKYR